MRRARSARGPDRAHEDALLRRPGGRPGPPPRWWS